ncbi:replication initiator protein [Sigmofec virus UA08Rod_5307]|uniref:Replication initiator protein n=1 Tax=Sigmofec virus UA08Rod_5307 TaxID=2929418 RepID=A0A976N2A8_9VIRU|nr:replication initiator protein [Sigmofec virus UA08Rod_5307]
MHAPPSFASYAGRRDCVNSELPRPISERVSLFSPLLTFGVFMCLFPVKNRNVQSDAYRAGIKYFDCGTCPECLRQRSNVWVLRAVAESRLHAYSCMCTLTYDNYAYDSHGNIIGELPPDRDLHVCKRDIQLFVKRLRKKFGAGVKYLCNAEYGSRTHRAHYHILLFGVKFADSHFYKKSKRGNVIYRSETLTSLWHHGICTIDSINVRANVAAYCTKYCSKQRSEDTFILASKNLGLSNLLETFNGKSYVVEGREHPVPRQVWQHYITDCYDGGRLQFSPRYVNKTEDTFYSGEYDRACELRRNYRFIRDSDPTYVQYLSYWQNKITQIEMTRPDIRTRILQLPKTFERYQTAALRCYDYRNDPSNPYFELAPNSTVGLSIRLDDIYNMCHRIGIFCDYHVWFPRHSWKRMESHLPYYSCHNRANDTICVPEKHSGWRLIFEERPESDISDVTHWYDYHYKYWQQSFLQ